MMVMRVMRLASQRGDDAGIRNHPDPAPRRERLGHGSKELAMIEYLNSSGDVIAVRIEGRLSRDEMMGIVDLIERAFAANEKTHLYAEIADYHGFDWTALGEYLPHALKMLGQREKFGRIAIVSDLAWLRWASRVESALIPGLSYETYTMEEREQALAWVEGRSPWPHGPALTLIETDKPDVLGFELDGRIGAEEMHALVARIGEMMESRPGPVRLLGRLKNFKWPAPGGLDADYVRMKLKALHKVERYAVVGGPLWLVAWVSAMGPLLKLEVRHFPADKEAEAWQWLGAKPTATCKEAA
jgi:hypothetical protein